jgi:hypothetical protein
MKKIIKTLAVVLCMLVAGTTKIGAQNAYISIAGTNETPITNLVVNDFIGTDNKITYTASFDISITPSDNVKAILSQLQSNISENKTAPITLSRANFNYELEEAREYASATVEQMTLSEMDASSKSAVKINVKIKSVTMSIRSGKGEKISLTGAKNKATLSSNFQFNLGILPAKKISKISALNIRNNDELQDFTIELSGADSKEWYDWLQKSGKGMVKTEQGLLSLLGPDLKETLFDINISDVVITSYSFNNNESSTRPSRPGMQEAIVKVTIGLQARSVLFSLVR